MSQNKRQMFNQIILNHMLKYPKSEALDILKLIYQNEFGCGHLVKDEMQCLQMLMNEFNLVSEAETKGALFEHIGNGYSRISLLDAKKDQISAELIARLFYLSAKRQDGNIESFLKKVGELKELFRQNELQFYVSEIEDFVNEWRKHGCKPFSHSNTYRKNYRPCYRVIQSKYEDFFMLMNDIISRIKCKNIVVAIDGKCGSGKTTLAAELKEVFDCNVIRIDDFFLPMHLRTSERLKEPGSNIHYERFLDEVVSGLKGGKNPIEYGVFDCSTMSLAQTEKIYSNPITIIEGVYSLHPNFADIYDIKVFCDADAKLQKARIITRNGSEMYKKFESVWIPMEEKYFETFDVKAGCNYIYNFK